MKKCMLVCVAITIFWLGCCPLLADIVAGVPYEIFSSQGSSAYVTSTIDLDVEVSPPITDPMFTPLPPYVAYVEHYMLSVHGMGFGDINFQSPLFFGIGEGSVGVVFDYGWPTYVDSFNGNISFYSINFEQMDSVHFVIFPYSQVMEMPYAFPAGGSPYVVAFSWEPRGGDSFTIHIDSTSGSYEFGPFGADGDITTVNIYDLPHGVDGTWYVSSHFFVGTDSEYSIDSWPVAFSTYPYDIMPNGSLSIGDFTLSSTLGINVELVSLDSTPVFEDLPNYANLTGSVAFKLNGSGTGNLTVHFNSGHWYGYAYYDGIWHWGSPHSLMGPGSFTFSNVGFVTKGDVYILMGSADPTLPIELSSFTAVATSENCVSIRWVTQSETQVLGYYVYKSDSPDFNTADRLNPTIIPASNTSQASNYSFNDYEVSIGNTYYYWLENVDITGDSQVHGPISVTLMNSTAPPIPDVSELGNIYPNPLTREATGNVSVSVKDGEIGVLSIYNLRGQMIKRYRLARGYHDIPIYGHALSNGIYIYRLQTESMAVTKKFMVKK